MQRIFADIYRFSRCGHHSRTQRLSRSVTTTTTPSAAMRSSSEDMHQIHGRLYLGNIAAARNHQELRQRNIGTVLTVMQSRIPDDDRHHRLDYHWIDAEDRPEEDLLTEFPKAFDIIDQSLKSGAGILVHCKAGVSRSATIVISYLMRAQRKTYKDAMDLVQSKRDIVGPNHGFRDQLRLYEWMGCRLNANDRRFRHYLLQTCVWYYFCSLREYFELLSGAEKVVGDELATGQRYQCSGRGCSQPLFADINVIRNDSTADKVCGRVFVEPRPWMRELSAPTDPDASEVAIKCPNCARVVAKVITRRTPLRCKCADHKGSHWLKIQMLDQSFKKSSTIANNANRS
ncbi:unnamed protein product [Medioppia subpectinata]|uniref:protein-tyrosine-phosphatase n=1 Tax=Medioppia subpectinata TaxID=1979941 RepID=A0A7R9KD88_9ACAR|nr:unnamed protein product [Medioppia subpectinata]CAG2100478.1 unnamed protein product [Medioppia subpectinata]